MLTAWSQLSVVNTINLGTIPTSFCSQEAKDILVNDFGWTITHNMYPDYT